MKYKKIFFLIIFFSLTAQAEIKKIRLGVSEEWSNELVRVKELILDSYSEIGYQVEFIALPPARSYSNNLHGSLDGEIARGVRFYDENFLLVEPSFLTLDIYAYYPKKLFPKIPDIESIKNSRVAFVNGNFVLKKYFENSDAVSMVKNEKQLLDMLMNNRVEFIFPLRNLNTDKLQLGKVLLFKMQIYHVLNPRNKEIRPKIEKVLKKNLSLPKYKNLNQQLKNLVQPR